MNREGQIFYLIKFTNEVNSADYPLNQWTGDVPEVEGLKRNFPDMFPNGKILDVGTGEGRFLAAAQHSGFTGGTGLEPVEKLAQLGKSAGLDIHVGRFEPDSMPHRLAETTFDIVCFRESIYYLPDLREGFDLLRKILRPGGGLYIRSHVPTSIYYWKNKNYLSRYGPSVSGIPTLKAMIRILLNEGYEIINTGYVPFNALRTLGLSSGRSFIEGIIGGRILFPMLRRTGKADRTFILARRL